MSFVSFFRFLCFSLSPSYSLSLSLSHSPPPRSHPPPPPITSPPHPNSTGSYPGSKAGFGTSITPIGDFNKDGIIDVFVGASASNVMTSTTDRDTTFGAYILHLDTDCVANTELAGLWNASLAREWLRAREPFSSSLSFFPSPVPFLHLFPSPPNPNSHLSPTPRQCRRPAERAISVRSAMLAHSAPALQARSRLPLAPASMRAWRESFTTINRCVRVDSRHFVDANSPSPRRVFRFQTGLLSAVSAGQCWLAQPNTLQQARLQALLPGDVQPGRRADKLPKLHSWDLPAGRAPHIVLGVPRWPFQRDARPELNPSVQELPRQHLFRKPEWSWNLRQVCAWAAH